MNLRINCDGNWVNDRELPVEELRAEVRTQRGLKTFAKLLFSALVSVFIPVMHFLLVPGFLISSFVYGFRKYKEIYLIDLGGFDCPSCGTKFKEQRVSLREDETSTRLFCYSCRKNTYLYVE